MAWNPWRALRAAENVRFARRRLPEGFRGAIRVHRDGQATIVMDDRLLAPERRAVLAHELLHAERGGGAAYAGQPSTWAAVVARDEHQVDAEVARRLVPAGELEAWLQRADAPVGVLEVAEEFDVPLGVAELALQQRAAGRPPAWMA